MAQSLWATVAKASGKAAEEKWIATQIKSFVGVLDLHIFLDVRQFVTL